MNEMRTYTLDVSYDGTRTGYIAACVKYLAEHDPEAVSASFVFDGELIVIDAAMARGEVRN